MNNIIAYIPAGFPDIAVTGKILKRLDRVPLKAVEVGVPFSDPVADGPTIQKAYHAALEKKVTLESILEMLEGLTLSCDLYLMSYLNPVMNYRYGRRCLEKRLKKAGIKGLIIPDLPLKEMEQIDLDFPKVVFTAPNTTDKEIEKINKLSPPFVYYVARYGVTGTRADMPELAALKRLKKKLRHSLYAGFGISSFAQARAVGTVADGAIVGSVLVKEIDRSSPQKAAEAVTVLARRLVGSRQY